MEGTVLIHGHGRAERVLWRTVRTKVLNRHHRHRNPSCSLRGSREPPLDDLHYSLWYYSTDRSTISLRMQERRRQRLASITAEKAFGAILRDIRKERRFSQESLAFESGYHSTYIGQLERGQKSPSLRTIMDLAGTLKTPGSEMLRRVEARLGRTVPERRQR